MHEFIKYLKKAARYSFIGMIGFLLLFLLLTYIFGDTSLIKERLKGSYELFLTFFTEKVEKETTVKPKSDDTCDEKSTLEKIKKCTVLVGNTESHGSGFVIENNGYLVTNYHVVKNSTDGFTNVLYKGELIRSRIAGISEKDDIAIVEIPKTFENCSWAMSNEMKIAENVYAIGWPNSPYGEATITKGIFSRNTVINDQLSAIQTDTAINPGNSGGPLVNACGVVGINTAKQSWVNDKSPSEGIGFAISSEHAIKIVGQLIKNDTGKAINIPQTSIPETKQGIENTLIQYDYNQVIFWEQRKIQDQKLYADWESAKDSEYIDIKNLESLLQLLKENITIAERLWDGYTNTLITYLEVINYKQKYLENSSKIELLIRELNIEGSINAYKSCMDSWAEMEKEYKQEFSEQKKECEKFIEFE